MKKKRKVSYSDFAPEGANSQGSGVSEQGSANDHTTAAAKPEPVAPAPVPPPVVAPEVVPEVEMKRRVSSPVEIAAALRQSPAAGLPAFAEPPSPAVTDPAVPDDRQPATDNRPVEIEDYATILARRLAAMAPPELDESEQMDRDERPLRERVRSAEGVADLLMFRIGPEIFATDLASVEEAVSLPEIHHLPEMPAAMLGAFNLRGRLTPVYSPAHVIGVPLAGAAQAALLVSANGRRLGLAVDDVEDVFQVDLATVREAPGIDDADGILLGVAHHGQELVTVLDAEALVAACLTGNVMETA